MRASLSTVALAASFVATALAQNSTGTSSGSIPEYTLQADGITAKLIPYGARLTSLIVADRNGDDQDIAVGYDDPQEYVHDSETNHTYFGKSALQASQKLC